MLKTRFGALFYEKLAVFKALQEICSRFSTFVYHNLNKVLWIDLDTSKEFGFEVVAFYTAKKIALSEGK